MDTVVMDWVKIGAAAASFILVLKLLVLHWAGKILPTGARQAVAAI